jgi:cytochrome c
MKRPILSVLVVVAAVMPLTGALAAEEAPARPAAFAVCAGCHTVDPGKTSYGPNLRGVVGRKAGSLPGYAYSDALKASDMVWSVQNLDKWLTSPQKTVPGTKMPFTGYADPEKRRQIIDYLLALD